MQIIVDCTVKRSASAVSISATSRRRSRTSRSSQPQSIWIRHSTSIEAVETFSHRPRRRWTRAAVPATVARALAATQRTLKRWVIRVRPSHSVRVDHPPVDRDRQRVTPRYPSVSRFTSHRTMKRRTRRHTEVDSEEELNNTDGIRASFRILVPPPTDSPTRLCINSRSIQSCNTFSQRFTPPS
jgi:hypothetical protein